MRAQWMLVAAVVLAGCSGATPSSAPQEADATTPAPTGADWSDLSLGLAYDGTGPTALLAEIRVPSDADCELSVAGEFNSTGAGLQFMTLFQESSGGGSATSYGEGDDQVLQVGPVDTRSTGSGTPGSSVGTFLVDGHGMLAVGIADAQPLATSDAVAAGTVAVTSSCSGATGRWSTIGVDPVFFVTDSTDGVLLVGSTDPGVAVAAARGFEHNLDTPRAVLVVQMAGNTAGVLEATSPEGTQTWNLATERRIWRDAVGGQQDVRLHQAGSGSVYGMLFGAER